MDLLKPEDVERNSQVIAVGYGLENEADKRKIDRPLKFSRLNMFMEPDVDLNITIAFSDINTIICPGRSS